MYITIKVQTQLETTYPIQHHNTMKKVCQQRRTLPDHNETNGQWALMEEVDDEKG